jgi:hypothetical protein
LNYAAIPSYVHAAILSRLLPAEDTQLDHFPPTTNFFTISLKSSLHALQEANSASALFSLTKNRALSLTLPILITDFETSLLRLILAVSTTVLAVLVAGLLALTLLGLAGERAFSLALPTLVADFEASLLGVVGACGEAVVVGSGAGLLALALLLGGVADDEAVVSVIVALFPTISALLNSDLSRGWLLATLTSRSLARPLRIELRSWQCDSKQRSSRILRHPKSMRKTLVSLHILSRHAYPRARIRVACIAAFLLVLSIVKNFL